MKLEYLILCIAVILQTLGKYLSLINQNAKQTRICQTNSTCQCRWHKIITDITQMTTTSSLADSFIISSITSGRNSSVMQCKVDSYTLYLCFNMLHWKLISEALKMLHKMIACITHFKIFCQVFPFCEISMSTSFLCQLYQLTFFSPELILSSVTFLSFKVYFE